MYYPRYKRKRTYPQYTDFYRVKLILNYIYQDINNLLEFSGNVFRIAIKAYDYYIQYYEYTVTDGYSEAKAKEVQAEDNQFKASNAADKLTIKDQ